jgi:hypothetical protein
MQWLIGVVVREWKNVCDRHVELCKAPWGEFTGGGYLCDCCVANKVEGVVNEKVVGSFWAFVFSEEILRVKFF